MFTDFLLHAILCTFIDIAIIWNNGVPGPPTGALPWTRWGP
jgi:hypothetical protein